MGTNYYLRQRACSQCGHASNDQLHIGKSSAGWNFGLRIYPKVNGEPDFQVERWGVDAICELADWLVLFDCYPIFDEYGDAVSADDMVANIANRSHSRGLLSRLTAGPEHMGPYPLDRTTLFAGKGTYDLCAYNFS